MSIMAAEDEEPEKSQRLPVLPKRPQGCCCYVASRYDVLARTRRKRPAMQEQGSQGAREPMSLEIGIFVLQFSLFVERLMI